MSSLLENPLRAKRAWWQGLRNRTILRVSFILLCLFLGMLIPLRLFFLESFLKIEHENMLVDINRAQKVIALRQSQLSETAFAWAAWDDAYEYIAAPDPAFIEANLPAETFSNYNFDLMLYIQASGKIVYGQYITPEQGELALPSELLNRLAAQPSLVQLSSPEDKRDSIILTQQGPMLVAIRPITTTRLQGPIRGSVLMGRLIRSGELEEMTQVTSFPFSIYSLKDPQLPADVRTAIADKAANTAIVQVLNQQNIAGYMVFPDMFGQAAIAIKIEQPRTIYAQGFRNTIYFLIALGVMGLLFGSLMLFIVQRQVLRRVTRLGREVQEVADGNNAATHVSILGNDEITDLAIAFNTSLDTLQRMEQEHLQSRLQEREQQEQIKLQESALNRLAVPLIPFGDRMVILPLLGELSTFRMTQIQEKLLEGVTARRSSMVVIDLTGVPTMDAIVAKDLLQIARMLRLLGAKVVLTGLSAAVAMILADLELDFHEVTICATLQEGANQALATA